MSVREIMTAVIRKMVAVSPEHADRIAFTIASELYDSGWRIVKNDPAKKQIDGAMQ